jgi:secreted trypsin-like serine protease
MWSRPLLIDGTRGIDRLLSFFRPDSLERNIMSLAELPRVAVELPASLVESLQGGGADGGGGGSSSLLDYSGFVTGGAASGTASVRIINGVDVNVGRSGAVPYPWYVQLRRRSGTTSFMLCGGSIVHAWQPGVDSSGAAHPAGFWVVTAAHCLTSAGSAYTVNVYTGGQAEGEPIRNVGAFPVPSPTAAADPSNSGNAPGWLELPPGAVQIFAHPNYDPDTNHRDVALVRCVMPEGVPLPRVLTNGPGGEVNWSAVARLPVRSSLPSAAAIIGFGATSAGGSVAHVLQYGAVRVEDRAVRQDITAHPAYSPPLNTWATGPVNAQGEAVDTCQGDSGGPLFSFELEGDARVGSGNGSGGGPDSSEGASQFRSGGVAEVHTVHAVTSWGISCGVPRYPGVYAKLAPFVAPPPDTAAARLPASSPWRLGMVGMISALSPTPYRGLPADAVVVPDGDDGGGNDAWADGGDGDDEVTARSPGTAMVVTGAVLAAAVVGGAAVVYAMRKKGRNASSLGGGGTGVRRKGRRRSLR